MSLVRAVAGLVVAGWLGAAAGCAGADLETEPSAEAPDAPALAPAQIGSPVPTLGPVPIPAPAPMTLRIDNPGPLCHKTLLPGSTFGGYIVSKATVGDDSCPAIATPVGQWAGQLWDVRAADQVMIEPHEAYFVNAGAGGCLYSFAPKSGLFFPTLSTPQQRYDALMASLGYPDHPSRTMLGVDCKPAPVVTAAPESAAAPTDDIAPCRQCANAHVDAVEL